jgi:tripartite-type tricarboxylate transporter receptor subunit TctC
MIRMRIALSVIAASALIAAARPADAADDGFFKGRQVFVIIGFSAGGGYDLYARLLAKHMGGHLSGATLLPQNMPGAGSLKAANYIYNVAPKDGTYFGIVEQGVLFEPLFGNEGAQFDAQKFGWIGGVNAEVSTCVAWHNSPVKTFEEAFTKEMTVGGTGPGSDPYVFPRVLNAVLGTKFKLISGYPGTNEIWAGMENGELDGLCGWYWSSITSRKNDWLVEKKIIPMIQIGIHKHPDHPDVPLVLDYAKTESDRQVLELTFANMAMGRPFMAPPGMPAGRLATLRGAFADTMKDPGFLADAAKAKLEVNPTTGEEIDALLKRLYAYPPAVVERAAQARK